VEGISIELRLSAIPGTDVAGSGRVTPRWRGIVLTEFLVEEPGA